MISESSNNLVTFSNEDGDKNKLWMYKHLKMMKI